MVSSTATPVSLDKCAPLAASSLTRVRIPKALAATVATWWSIIWFIDTIIPLRISCFMMSIALSSSISASCLTLRVSGRVSVRLGGFLASRPELGRLASWLSVLSSEVISDPNYSIICKVWLTTFSLMLYIATSEICVQSTNPILSCWLCEDAYNLLI